MVFLWSPGTTLSEEAIDFNRDIRPILSDSCFKCHGPDAAERHADLRLDTEQGIEDAEDVISPGDWQASELYRRIVTDDHDQRMPPPDSGRILSDEQKDLLKRWIDSGAQWQNHWSFVAPVRAAASRRSDDRWSNNEVDLFVLKKLDEMGLSPNVEAKRGTLIRRICLDLTGLPAEMSLLKRYSDADNANWYEDLVDELLASDHYGEHMARFWLDAARYADTHGLHLDNYREMWLYRDWVIDAFNSNLPYSDFVIHQIAGDLLPQPTTNQLIATGFNRAHVTTNEGGSILEEIRVRNVVDRVSTTGTVFMGLTLGCAQCHDHKYDPISQKDFYSMYAFFNSLDANAMDGNIKDHPPILRQFDEEENKQLSAWKTDRDSLKNEIAALINEFADSYVDSKRTPSDENVSEVDDAVPVDVVWFDDELPKSEAATGEATKLTGDWEKNDKDGPAPFSGKKLYFDANDQFSQLVMLRAEPRLKFNAHDTLFVHVYLDPEKTPKEIMVQFNDGSWEHRGYWGENRIEFGVNDTTSRLRLGDLPEAGKWHRLEIKAEDIGFEDLTSIHGIAFSQHGGKVYWDVAGAHTAVPQSYEGESFEEWLIYQGKTDGLELPKTLREQLKNDPENEEFVVSVKEHFFRSVHPRSKRLIEKQIAADVELQKKIEKVTAAAPTTLIWKEKQEPVEAFVLNRGEYDQKGEKVVRATPQSLPAFNETFSNDRLGLANWLVSPEHPLTSRVAVNRYWQQFFGIGLVATADDFGSQGELPSHPELLDWLSVEFRENGWDVKALVKKIVMSSTYRQSSHASPEKLRVDSANRFFCRGPRFRLDAETLRDQALSVAGILVPTIGGPAVKPPQPDGLWFAVGYSRSNTVRFKKDQGHEKVHRRSLYTFWKRSSPPPQMSTLDAPTRESCIVRRERTNTPLQALLMMNDPQYVEAARYFAQLAMDAQLKSDEEVVEFMYSRAMANPISAQRLKIMLVDLAANTAEFEKDPESAKLLISIGENPPDSKYDPVRLASLTMLANLILNLDEFITKN